jgi:outer membrane receptor protein involved in Fe transport
VSKNAAIAPLVRASVAACLGLSLIGFPAYVIAADAEDDEEVLQEVTVTGTRIQSPNVTSANPVTSISGEELRRLGIVNISDALTQLVPQNISSYMPTLTGDNQAGFGGGGMDTMDRGSYFIGNTIANLRGLDPTFGTRTLTLVNGRRVASTSNQADVVDLNTIPASLLERMDVVTGGASATYGSGAVAGVVNMVLNTKLDGVKFDASYLTTERGDGSSPTFSLSAGTPLLGGKGHALFNAEYQKTAAIRNCATARGWCADSRALFTNSSGSQENLLAANQPLVGYEGMPARFETANMRYEQRYSEGAIYHNDADITSGFRFDPFGFGGTEYAYGYRGGASTQAINGSGLPVTSTQPLQPSNERKVLFTHFEYNFTERTSGYLEARYANTEALNRNQQTTGTYCARFDTQGQASSFAPAGANLYYSQAFTGSSGFSSVLTQDGQPYPPDNAVRSSQFANNLPQLAAFLRLPSQAANAGFTSGNGLGPGGVPYTPSWPAYTTPGGQTISAGRGISWPYWIPVSISPNPPTDDFDGWARDPNTGEQIARGTWRRVRFTDSSYAAPSPEAVNGGTFWTPWHANDFWLLESVELLRSFDGTPLVLPQVGRNAYAFLNNLSPEALLAVQSNFGNSGTAGAGNLGVQQLYGANPCTNMTAIRKLWNPQIERSTRQVSDTYGATLGIKGRFGSDWQWDAYYQYGSTNSSSRQYNVATNLRMAFALDAVIDDRKFLADGVTPNPTYGTPICRVTRDAIPLLNGQGRPLSSPAELAALGEGCQPLNLFGTEYSNMETFGDTIEAYEGIYYDAAELQRQALDYAFVDSRSAGKVSQQTLAVNTSGTLWQGWGAGPVTAAMGVELRENKQDNEGTEGGFYQRADLASVWSDAFGGRTRVTEAYTEVNVPLLSGLEGVNLLSINGAARYGWYNNKGGAGTTGESATQRTPNWKFSAMYEPYDWIRTRVTRSRDLRAADYRDLFRFQPGMPDEFTIRNPWRAGTPTSNENQQELYGQVQVGNANLKPETSDTLTVGVVLSPGGWAQGLRLSVDYFDIRVKNGINTPFNASNPVTACFEGSNNGLSADYFNETGETPLPPNMTLQPCRELTFAPLLDDAGNPIPGQINLQDLVSYNSARPTNSLPYQRRGMDFNASFTFPLNRAFETLPGSVALNVRATRALESSGVQQQSSPFGFYGPNPSGECGAKLDAADPMNYVNNDPSTGQFRETIFGEYVVNRYTCVDMVGQIRTSVFIPGVAATPEWSGNVTASYLWGDLTTSLLMRYIGGAKFDKRWIDDPTQPGYYAEDGRPSNASVDNNTVKPYARFDLSASYNLKVASMRSFRVFGSITNLFDKTPPFTGGGISGASAGSHDTLGRSYRLGIQTQF